MAPPMRLLLTAFEPYGEWSRNSSWETLIAWVSQHGGRANIITRKYPVNLVQLQARLDRDLAQGVDAVLHLGQAPGISRIHLESIAVNVAGVTEKPSEEYGPILENAPLAYRSVFPVGQWVSDLKREAIPAAVSYHAGTYLCNAAMFLSHHWFAGRGEIPRVGFVHLPLLPEQAVESSIPLPSLPLGQSVRALGMLVERVLEFTSHELKTESHAPAPTQTA